jgi:phage-related protein
LPFVALIVALWNHFHKQIESTAKTVWNALAGFFESIWHGLADAAKFIWGLIKSYIVQPVEEVWRYLKAGWHTFAGWMSTAWHGISSVASSIWGSIKRNMIQPITDTWHTITRIMGQVKDAISGKLHEAFNAVRDVGKWFESIGTWIVHGIVSGIEGAAGSLFGSLKDLASNALSSAKSFLGINSPSREFAEQVGHWIPHGIAEGVRNSAHAVKTAVNEATGAALGRVNVGGQISLGMGTSGGYGGTTTVINVHVEGSVMAEQDLRDVLQREMLRLGARNSGTWQPYRR